MSTLQILLSGTSRVPNKYYYQVPHEYLTNTTIRYLISTFVCEKNLYIIYKIYLRLESSVWVYNNFHSFVIIYQNNDEI